MKKIKSNLQKQWLYLHCCTGQKWTSRRNKKHNKVRILRLAKGSVKLSDRKGNLHKEGRIS